MKQFKVMLTGQQARKKLKEGIDKVAEIIGATLGPAGRNCVIENDGGRKVPMIVNDGVTIAHNIIMEDPIADQGAQLLVNVATKTSDMAGDGTTTSVVLAKAIIDEAEERSKPLLGGTQNNVMDIKREIEENCKKTVEELKKMAVPVEDKADMEKVAIVAIENEEMGKMVADIVDKVGPNGYVIAESGFKYETEYEVINGMRFIGSYISPSLINDRETLRSVYEDVAVLVTERDIDNVDELDQICGKVVGDLKKKRFVIISPKFDHLVIIPTMIETTLKASLGRGFKVLGIKVPSLDRDQLEDIAIYTGATFISKEGKKQLSEVEAADMGIAKKIVVDEDNAFIFEGGGDKEVIEERIKLAKSQLKAEKTDYFKPRLEERIASLSGGIGIIRVGTKTDIERNYLRLKVQNCVNSTRSAKEEGVVAGGGLALKKIAEILPENILTKALKAPWKKIQDNAPGKKLAVGKDILDPVKVARVALENACSMAGLFITTESCCVWERSPLDREIKRLIVESGTDMENR